MKEKIVLFADRRVRATLIIIGLLILALGALSFVPIAGDTLWHRVVAVIQLRGVYITKNSSETIAPSGFGMRGLTDFSVKGVQGTLGDFAIAQGTRVAVITSQNPAAVTLEEFAPTPQTLSREPGAKASVALSQEGTIVAYALAADGGAFSTKLSGWHVRLIDISTGIDSDLGEGFGPQFFTKDGTTWVLFASTKGISVIDTKTLNGFITPYSVLDTISFAPRVSPDGAYLAMRDSATQKFNLFELYRVTKDMPLGMNPVPTDISSFSDVTFMHDTLFGMSEYHKSIGGITVSTLMLGASGSVRPLYTFVADDVYRFVP